MGVAEGAAHGLAGNAVDFVAQNRMEVARLAFDSNTKDRGVSVGVIPGKLF